MKRIFMFLLAILVYTAGSQTLAQSVGTISGIIQDEQGDFLPGATVQIQELQKGTISDRYGKFVLTKVPAGTYKLTVSFIGFETQTIDASVSAGETTVLNVTLKSGFIELADVAITSVRKGQVKALTEQKNADNIVSVLSIEEISKYPDVSAADAMKRMPGVHVHTTYGESRFVSIRGTSPSFTSVTVNGQKLSSPTEDERYIGLDVINAGQLGMLEVSKTLTPDMEGDAIGGSVNLITKSAFDQDKTFLNVKASAGLNTFGADPLYNTEFTFSTLLGNNQNVGLTIGGNWNRNMILGEQTEFKYGEADLPDGTLIPFALDQFKLMHSDSRRNRKGLNMTFDFRAGENHTFFINGMYNDQSDYMERNTVVYRPGKGDYLTPTTVSGARMQFELSARDEIQSIAQFSAGGKSKFGGLQSDYGIAYGFAEQYKEKQYKSEWQLDEKPDLLIDHSDIDFPGMTITNLDEGYSYNAANWQIDNQDWKTATTLNSNLSAHLDFKIDYNLGSATAELKFGGMYRKENKNKNNTRIKYKWRGDDAVMMDQVSSGKEIEDFLFGNYTLSPMIDYDKYHAFFEANKDKDDALRPSPNYDDTDGIGGRYDANEAVTAGYIMQSATVGKFKAMVGLRNEFTQTDYEGKELIYDPGSGDITGTKPVTTENSYNNIFPHLHLQYDFSKSTDLRFAATTGIVRPRYFDITPYLWIYSDVIVRGNPTLSPTTSVNYDLMFGHYFKGIGVFNIGVFGKQLKDIMYQNSQILEGGLYDGYLEVMTVNGDNATLYGFEVNWMQQLTFLPGFANGFGISANYTYTESNTDIERMDKKENIRHITSIPGQLGNVGNIGLNYEKYGFNARLSLYFADDYIYSVEQSEDYDRYKDKYSQLDFTCSYGFNKNLEIFAQVSNITNSVNRDYFHVSSRPRMNQYVGTSFMLGLKFSL